VPCLPSRRLGGPSMRRAELRARLRNRRKGVRLRVALGGFRALRELGGRSRLMSCRNLQGWFCSLQTVPVRALCCKLLTMHVSPTVQRAPRYDSTVARPRLLATPEMEKNFLCRYQPFDPYAFYALTHSTPTAQPRLHHEAVSSTPPRPQPFNRKRRNPDLTKRDASHSRIFPHPALSGNLSRPCPSLSKRQFDLHAVLCPTFHVCLNPPSPTITVLGSREYASLSWRALEISVSGPRSSAYTSMDTATLRSRKKQKPSDEAVNQGNA
jgi:hypothetical protein